MEKYAKKWLLRNSVLLIFIALNFNCTSQVYYSRTYDFSTFEGFDAGHCVIDDTTIFINGSILIGGFWNLNLIKINAINGDTIWKREFKEPSRSYTTGYGNGVSYLNGFLYAGATIVDTLNNAKPVIFKLYLNGDTVWKKEIITGFNFTTFSSMQITRDGNLIFGGMIGITPTNSDLYLAKCDTAGNLLWDANFGGALLEDVYSIDTTADGGFVLAGYTNSYGAGSYDAYAVKVDSLGNFQWHKWFGNTDSDWGFIKSQPDSTYLIYGGMTSSSGIVKFSYIKKLNALGNIIWQKDPVFPPDNTGSNNNINGIVLDLNSNIVVMGNYSSILIGNNPIGFIYKLNQNGDSLLFRNYYVRSNDNYLNSISLLSDGGFIMAGYVFPDGSGNTEDGWLIRVDSMGCENMSCALSVDEIQEENRINLEIFPNPNNGIVSVSINNQTIGDLFITDLSGRILIHKNVSTVNSKFDFTLNDITSGVYLVIFNSDNGKTCEKMVVAK